MSLRNVGIACLLLWTPALLSAPAAMAETCGTADFTGRMETLRLRRPVMGQVVVGFGMRTHPILRVQKQHYGLDIAAPTGETVVAAAKGQVAFAGSKGEYGNAVVIEHGNGLVTVYAHLNGFAVKEVGACVEPGAAIGYIGSTGLSSGPQLHFEVIVDGNHLDPAPIIGAAPL